MVFFGTLVVTYLQYVCDYISHFLQSFDDLMAKLQISRYPVKIVDSEGQDKGKSVEPDYVVNMSNV